MTVATYTRADVAKHDKYDDAWIIIDNGVYDISKWIDKHPGGKVLLYYRGQDATEPVYAFHPDMEKTRRYMKATYIGELADPAVKPIVADFRKLREELRTEGYFKPRYYFYILHLLSIFMFEYIAYLAVANYGSMLAAAVFLAIAQIQAGWLQHDLGHCAVFKSAFWNQAAHYFLISHLKGASSWWWKSKHNRHHAKTNIVTRDPDMHIEPFFSFSENMAKTRYSKYVPFLEHQHRYWFVLGPPMVTTFLFVIQNMVYMAEFGKWVDMAATLTFFVKFELLFHNHLTTGQVIGLYFMMRFIESHWFTWVTSMNHLPRPILEDSEIDWLKLQVDATQNIDGGFFNNWFTGHLNYQVEHHLFPTMPRHRYPEVAARVRALCERNGLKYRVRGLWQSFVDVVDQLGVIAVVYKEEKQKRKLARAQRAAGASPDKPAVAIKQQ